MVKGFTNKNKWSDATTNGFRKTHRCSVKKSFFSIVVLNEIWTPSLLFYHRFRNSHFRTPLSGSSNAVSSTPTHKKNKTKKKLLDFIELVGYCFCFISLLQSKFQILSFLQYHIYFSWITKEKKKKEKKNNETKQKHQWI